MTVREELHSTVKNRKSKNDGMKGAQWRREKLEKQKWRYERSSMVP
jgi:hypothetical protein